MKKIGLALGGGGAKGVAHVLMIEALEELGLTPAHIAGTSIGAIVGLLYCSGIKAALLRQAISDMTLMQGKSIKQLLTEKKVLKWLDFISLQFHGPGILKVEHFIDFLFHFIKARTFEELKIPLTVVASDFWAREQVVLNSGELIPAIQASMTLPGIFPPVIIGDRVLIDGGAVNPVPFDLLPKDCDLTIAVDIIGRRSVRPDQAPSLFDSIFNTFQIMEKSIINEKLKNSHPDIYIEPDISDVRVLEFYKANHIFDQAQPAKDELKRQIEIRLKQIL